MGLNEASGGLGGDIAGLGDRWKKERVGPGNPNFGLKRSDDTKKKMADSMRKYYHSEKFTEHRRSICKTDLSKKGAEAVKGSTWWNNCSDNIRSFESPGPGWVKGRLPYERTYQDTEYYAKKQTTTKSVAINGTTYFSINDASRKTGKCRQTIRKMIKNGI
jgi:hypothetical protein